MNGETRQMIQDGATSVWLKADLELLVSRTVGREHRPLLKGKEPRQVLEQLMSDRYPVYAEADLCVNTRNETPEATVKRVMDALDTRAGEKD